MLVCYLTDEPGKIPAVRAMLEPHHHVVPRLLGDGVASGTGGVLMVDADLREMVRVEQIKQSLSELHAITEKLFVVQQHLHHMVAQAFALGATSVLHSTHEIGPKLAQIEATMRAAASGAVVSQTSDCAKAFASMFSAVKHDKAINLAEAEGVTSHIIVSIERNGLSAWLDDVRRYHQGTFQHCLLVTGVAVGFALEASCRTKTKS
jgi:hypothetical protein